ncbi:hypothetical protein AURDEDRAFT_149666 [Auricularia subglabra TFB-10046 SS5]|nr:hypothetical protein AURDEDRAFT_149666 [Auricularia subglabra TFB-10046 SS5]
MLLQLPLALLAALPLAAANASQAPLADPGPPGPASTTLVDVLVADPNYSKLVRLLQVARLVPTLNRLDGSTLFAPTNDAIDRYNNRKDALWASALSDASSLDDNAHEALRQHLFYHLLNYTLKDDELPKEARPDVHQTLYFPRKPAEPPSRTPPPYPPWMPLPGGSLGGAPQRLRLSARDENTRWAGVDSSGAGGVEVGNFADATNGIVYAVEDVIELPGNIAKIIDEHPKLSYLARILPKEVKDALHDGEAFTLFLPTDDTWNVLDDIERIYLESKFSTQDVTNILNMHAISTKGVKWSDKLKDGSSYSTQYGNKVEVKIDDDGIIVGDARVVEPDIYAANGVVHLVQSLLIQPGALQLTPEKYLLALNCTKFVDLLHSVDLADMINTTDAKLTILAPRDDVMGVFDDPDELPEPGSDELREMMKYHFIPGRWTPEQLADGMLIESALYPAGLAGAAQVLDVSVEKKGGKGKDKDKDQVDISFGGSSVVGQAELKDLEVIIYFVSRPVTPPDAPLKIAVQQLHMSIFLASIFSASLETNLGLHPRSTFIIPDNSAFEQLGLVTTYLLLPSSKSDLEKVMEHHVLDGVFYADELKEGHAQSYRTLEGSDVHLTRRNGTLELSASGGWAGLQGTLATSNLLTSTGVIHELSGSVLLPRSAPVTVAKLAKAAKASTMASLVTRAGFDWVLDGSPPPPGSPYAAKDLAGAHWVLLAPTDDAFKDVNLTALHEDDYALRALVAQHIVPALPKAPAPLPGAPLYMGDAAAYTTGLSRDSYYGDVVFREVAPESSNAPDGKKPASRYVVGIRGARGTQALGDWARVTAWGRSTVGGGGVVQLDAVLVPYAPPWYIKYGQPAALLLVGVGTIAGFWYAVWLVWRRDTTEATYEPIGGFPRDDDDD